MPDPLLTQSSLTFLTVECQKKTFPFFLKKRGGGVIDFDTPMDYLLDDNALVDVVQALRRNSSSSVQVNSAAASSSAATAEGEIFGHAQHHLPGAAGSVATMKSGAKRGGGPASSSLAAHRTPRTNLTRAFQEQHALYLSRLEGALQEPFETQGSSSAKQQQQQPPANANATQPRKKGRKEGQSQRPPTTAVHNIDSSSADHGSAEAAAAWHLFSHWLATEDKLSLETAKDEEIHRVPSHLAILATTSAPTSSRALEKTGNHLCSVCLLPAPYRCERCRSALFCSVRCGDVHEGTRCQKFLA